MPLLVTNAVERDINIALGECRPGPDRARRADHLADRVLIAKIPSLGLLIAVALKHNI
jgi:hypothetical protein